MSRQQLKSWVAALSAGFGGPAISLAIQAQLPAHAPAAPQPGAADGTSRASRVASLTGVQA